MASAAVFPFVTATRTEPGPTGKQRGTPGRCASRSSGPNYCRPVGTTKKPALLPFDLLVNQLILQDTELQLPGQHVRISSLQTGIQLTANRLSLLQPELKQSRIALSAATNADSGTNPLPELLKLQLPFEVELHRLQVTDLKVQQGPQQLLMLQSLSTDLSLQPDHWQLQNTSLQLQQPALTLQGEIALQPFSQQLLLQLQLNARSADLPQLLELKLSGKGPLSACNCRPIAKAPGPCS